MVVKANQPGVLARIQALPWKQVPVCAVDDTHGHGRTEHRSLRVVATTGEIGFPHARQVIRITRDRHVHATDTQTREVVYAVCSLPFAKARPDMIASWLRSHWEIENAVHHVRDVTYDEDRSQARTGAGPQVLATLRNTAMNLHRLDGATNIAEACRTAAFTPDRRIDLLNPQNPSSQAC